MQEHYFIHLVITGSTVFDDFNGYTLQIIICDMCLRSEANTNIHLVSPDLKERQLWRLRDTFEEE